MDEIVQLYDAELNRGHTNTIPNKVILKDLEEKYIKLGGDREKLIVNVLNYRLLYYFYIISDGSTIKAYSV